MTMNAGLLKMTAKLRNTSAVVVLLTPLASCGPPMRVFVHPEADLGYYEKVGVVPFRSLTGDRFAGEKFTVEFITALLASEKFQVVDYGVFTDALAKVVGSRSAADGLNVEEMKKVAQKTGVQGIFEGTVKEYGMVSSGGGSFPVISVEARLLDAQSGQVVWMATASARGGPKAPVIGLGETHTLGALAQKLCRSLVGKIE